MVTPFPASWSCPGEFDAYPNGGMVPGYKQPALATDPGPLISGGRFLDTPLPSCDLSGPRIPNGCLNISKVSVTVISKHPKHYVHFQLQNDFTF